MPLFHCFCICQFGEMLDETAGSKFNMTGSQAMANRDKAGASSYVVVVTSFKSERYP